MRIGSLHHFIGLIAVALAGMAIMNHATAEVCPYHLLPKCDRCGCRGGAGWRGPDHRCVGFREFAKKCGPEPARLCTYEGAPNTGLNRECTLPHSRPGARKPPTS